MKLIFLLVNRIRSALPHTFCHTSVLVRSPIIATPFPCRRNFSIQRGRPSLEKGGLHHTKASPQGRSNPLLAAVKWRSAGIHQTVACPGDATSRSNRQPIARKTDSGAYHSGLPVDAIPKYPPRAYR